MHSRTLEPFYIPFETEVKEYVAKLGLLQEHIEMVKETSYQRVSAGLLDINGLNTQVTIQGFRQCDILIFLH